MRSKLKLFLLLLPFSLILGFLFSNTATKVRTAIRSQFAMQVEFIQRTEADRLADSLKQFDQTCRFAAQLDATTQFVAWSHQRPTSKDVVGLWRKQLQAVLSGLVRTDGETLSSIQEIAVLGANGQPLMRINQSGGELPLDPSRFEPFLESMGISSMSSETCFRSPVILVAAGSGTSQVAPMLPEAGASASATSESAASTDLLQEDSGDPTADSKADHDRLMYVGHPVLFENKVYGVLLLGVSLENLLSPVPSKMEVFGGRTSILTSEPSQSGEYLAHFERERVLNRQKDLNRTADFFDLKADADKILQPGNAFQKYLAGKNSRILLTVVPIGRTSWVLMTLIDTGRMLLLFENTLRSSMYLVIAALLGMTFMTIVFMSRWTQTPPLAGNPAMEVPPPDMAVFSSPREVDASELGFPSTMDSVEDPPITPPQTDPVDSNPILNVPETEVTTAVAENPPSVVSDPEKPN